MVLRSILNGCAILINSWFIFLVVRAIYRVTFHPLAKFPGPKFRAISTIPHAWSTISGNLPHDLSKLHMDYGDIVRFEPNSLTVITPEAWNDIYGHARARTNPKVGYGSPAPGVHSIVTAPDAETHARQRKVLSHAFSDRALKDQESFVHQYLNMLITKLRERASRPDTAVVNLVQWFDWTAFDIIGDLSFGEPFDCLKNSSYHFWVDTILQVVVAVSFITAAKMYSPLDQMLMMLAPKKAMEVRDTHTAMSKEKVHRRIELDVDRKDFWSYILARKDEGVGMSTHEMEVNAATLIIAGSETISTTCSGVCYHLCKNPALMKQLSDEIRGTFQSEDEINMTSVQQLKYLHAYLMEGMRLFPPAPAGAPRLTPPEGETIGEYFVPGNTTVMISQLAAYVNPKNFVDPLKYAPERWLGDSKYDADIKDVFKPFSVGPRNCIGKNLAWMETKMIMANMIWNFDMELQDDDFNTEKQKMHVLWQKPPLMVRLSKRKF
ncbi:cytochrome P450 4F3 omega-hydroxylase [Xylogone sp. PMI_703]|nr:cytochrome P450 4F3 omega-hydroxylase [Xylogone sp. PMI_703]